MPSITRQGGLACPTCAQWISLTPASLTVWFSGEPLSCDCGYSLAVWADFKRVVEDGDTFEALSLVGVMTTTITIDSSALDDEVDFSAHEVPADAQLLRVSYRGADDEGNALPLVPLYIGPLPQTRVAGGITLMPMPGWAGPPVAQAIVEVAWIPSGPPATPWRLLVSAFDRFADDDFEGAIIPANVAVESYLTPIVEDCLVRFSSRTRVSNVSQQLTYSVNLNVLLPALAALHGLPPLPEEVAGALNALRTRRNEMGHKGRTAPGITRSDVASWLTAALIANEYLRIADVELVPDGM